MAEPDDRFLSRWARLKEQDKARAPEPVAPPVEANEVAETQPEEDAAARERMVAALPDIDSLEESSDFTAFLQSGVPEELRQRALRKLWRLNPVFANLDGLNDYDDDFTDAATVIKGMKTLYQVGRGMVTPEDEAAEAAAAARARGEEVPEAETAEAQDAAPEQEPESPEPESPAPESPALESPGPEQAEPETDRAAPQPVGPVTPARAAKRRWGRFDSES